MAEKHKCTDCGFLALRRSRSQALVEASLVYRTDGRVPLRDDLSDREDTWRTPVCYKRRRNFLHEIMSEQQRWIAKGLSGEFPAAPLLNPYPDPEAAHPYIMVIMLSEQIECDDFTEYNQGFSPKEHQEMLDRQWKIKQEILVRDAVWKREDLRDATVEEQHADQMQLLREQHKEQMNVMEKQHGSEIKVFGILVTAAIVASTLIAAAIQADWIVQPRFWFQ